MPGFLVHMGAAVLCAHGGQAQATASDPRVLVGGQPVVTQPAPHAVAGCPFNVGGSPSPCVTGQWSTAATKVLAGGLPVLLTDSQATCVPNGTPLVITTTQTKVSGM